MEDIFTSNSEAQALEPGMPGGDEGGSELSEEALRQVRELLMALVKTKRAFEMYPANNPILIKFQEDLLSRFSSYFSENDKLELVIGKQEISCDGRAVYQNPEKDDNLALFFYRDGLRELTFKNGLTEDEIMDFIDVIRTRPDTSTDSYDDDVVTLMWEKDFVHVSYYIVEEFVEGDALAQDEVERLLEKGRESSGDIDGAYKEAFGDETETQAVFTPLETISLGLRGVFSLGEEEIISLKNEIDSLTDESFLQSALDVLFETLYLDKSTPDFHVLMDHIDSALNFLIEDGKLGMAALVLNRFRELKEKNDLFSMKEIVRMQTTLTRAGSPAAVKKLAEKLNSTSTVNPDELRLFLYRLDKAAILPLFDLMGELNDVVFRKVVSEALVSLGRSNIGALIKALSDKRWQVVRNAVAILGRIGDASAVEQLRNVLGHPEPNVRREVVRSLGMIGGPKAGEALLLATEDPDQKIRMAALRFMPRSQSYAVLDSLMDAVSRKDFEDKQLAEKRAFFEVLGEIGQDRVMGFMIKELKKRGLFGGAKRDESRAIAAYGLGNIRHEDARVALEKEMAKAKKGGAVFDAISYSLNKGAKAPGRAQGGQDE